MTSNTPDLLLEEKFLPSHRELFTKLRRSVAWDASMRARKTASFGKPYDYSQMNYAPAELLPCLVELRDQLAERLEVSFNNCLANYYETGENTMGYHADDTSGLLPGTGVAIVSLGSRRTISFRSSDDATHVAYELEPGSLLYMGADIQTAWKHAIARQPGAGPRISLTWRAVR
ncbi:alpha-ketoglutarate-dependent dioxygenase AlkB [Blastopirellula marina]|uniref:Fe2OG dioxygenase domain-containing protein n=1 Tax=Blastopirellula marina TaxID=124 RepID=A0A2S8F6A9_9BACT|nr:alpha-ketoglutarate-dependent dioxygenase AlkB [Blastopirellula marina]PQO27695.1 hypothetical protein C5Y98_26720 [Blastopirellula marina]PTL41434.1 hypothetical protein C5Y97_26735 [Blastopirellula marina]